jgi:hypothetical protein
MQIITMQVTAKIAAPIQTISKKPPSNFFVPTCHSKTKGPGIARRGQALLTLSTGIVSEDNLPPASRLTQGRSAPTGRLFHFGGGLQAILPHSILGG